MCEKLLCFFNRKQQWINRFPRKWLNSSPLTFFIFLSRFLSSSSLSLSDELESDEELESLLDELLSLLLESDDDEEEESLQNEVEVIKYRMY